MQPSISTSCSLRPSLQQTMYSNSLQLTVNFLHRFQMRRQETGLVLKEWPKSWFINTKKINFVYAVVGTRGYHYTFPLHHFIKWYLISFFFYFRIKNRGRVLIIYQSLVCPQSLINKMKLYIYTHISNVLINRLYIYKKNFFSLKIDLFLI